MDYHDSPIDGPAARATRFTAVLVVVVLVMIMIMMRTRFAISLFTITTALLRLFTPRFALT